MAALKIQVFYRSRRQAKMMMERERNFRILQTRKGIVMNGIFKYIIKISYRKIRLKKLLKTLDRMLKSKRMNLILSSVLLIQYNSRKFLKRLRIKREIERREMEKQKLKAKKAQKKAK